MKTLSLVALLALSGAWGAAAGGSAQPPQMRVPRVDPLERRLGPEAEARTHEVVLPADVVARPGESPAEALARALDGASPSGTDA